MCKASEKSYLPLHLEYILLQGFTRWDRNWLIFGVLALILLCGCATVPTRQKRPTVGEENAYLNYKKAVDLLKRPRGEAYYMYWKTLERGWFEEYKSLEQFLSENAPVLRELKSGTQRQQCRLPKIATPQQANEVLYYLDAFKELAGLVVVQTHYNTYKNRYKKAIEDSCLLIRFGQHIETSGNLISKRIGIAIQGNGYKNLRNVILQARAQRLNYSSLITDIASMGGKINHRRNFKEILTSQLSYIKIDLSPLFFNEQDWKLFKKSYQLSGYTPEDVIRSIRNAYYDAIVYSDFPYPEGLMIWKLPKKPRNPVRRRIMPILKSIYVECGRLETERDAAFITAGLEYYYSKNKSYPEKLSDLVPKYLPSLPPDPFSGKPFVYKKINEGWQIYSVGSDLEDNGGEKHSYYSEDGEGDIIFYSD